MITDELIPLHKESVLKLEAIQKAIREEKSPQVFIEQYLELQEKLIVASTRQLAASGGLCGEAHPSLKID